MPAVIIAAHYLDERLMLDSLRDRLSRWTSRQVRRLGHRAYFWLAALVSLVVLADVYHFHRVSGMQNRIFDTLMSLRILKPAPDADIVIVDVDEASLAAMAKESGRWPWPNQVFGEFLAGIEAQHPKAIVFDILFSDPDVARPDSDAYFNQVVAGTDNTWFPLLRLAPRNDGLSQIRPGMLPGLVALPDRPQEERPLALVLPHVPAALANGRLGAHNVEPDADGVIRHGLRYLEHAGWAIPSLAAAVAGTDLAHAPPDYLINWHGGPYSYRYVSFADIYQDLLRQRPLRKPNEFTDKIVLVGSTAPSLFDVKASPLAHIHPGVEMLATMIDNLKNDDYLRTQPLWLTAAVSLAFIWAMARALARQVRTDVFDGVFTGVQAGFLAISWASLNFSRHYLDLSAAITFGTLYFAFPRFYATQSRHWLANGHLYDLSARAAGHCMLTLLRVRTPPLDGTARRRLEREINRQVGLSPLGASRILNLVEDPGLVRTLFDDTILIYWLARDDEREAVEADCMRMEQSLGAWTATNDARPTCRRYSRVLAWQQPEGWRQPMRDAVLDALAATSPRPDEGAFLPESPLR